MGSRENLRFGPSGASPGGVLGCFGPLVAACFWTIIHHSDAVPAFYEHILACVDNIESCVRVKSPDSAASAAPRRAIWGVLGPFLLLVSGL